MRKYRVSIYFQLITNLNILGKIKELKSFNLFLVNYKQISIDAKKAYVQGFNLFLVNYKPVKKEFKILKKQVSIYFQLITNFACRPSANGFFIRFNLFLVNYKRGAPYLMGPLEKGFNLFLVNYKLNLATSIESGALVSIYFQLITNTSETLAAAMEYFVSIYFQLITN